MRRSETRRSLGGAVVILLLLVAGSVPPASAQEHGWRRFPYLVPAGDLDGDALSDFVSHEREPGTDVAGLAELGGQSVVTARRGSDGSVLWRYPTWADLLVPARLGAEAAQGVLVVAGEWIGTFGGGGSSSGHAFGDRTELRDLQLVALSGEGDALWELQFDSGLFTGVAFVDEDSGRRQVVVAERYPLFAGVLQATPSPALDVLVAIVHRREVLEEIQSVVEAVVVDGATGVATTVATVQTGTSRPQIHPAGDLDGDALDDFVVLREPMSGGLTARRGTDGSVLWVNPADNVPFFAFVEDLGDLSGDGAGELAVSGTGDVFDELPPRITVLDGATGSALLAETASTISAAGDRDGDGREEILTQRVISEPERAALYRVLDLDGRVVAERLYAVPVEDDTFVGLTPEAGLLDSDDIPDAGHTLVRYTGDEGRSDEGTVVSGRSLEPVFEGPAGQPLLASLDGEGDDLVLVERVSPGSVAVTAQDGATGASLWVRSLAVDAGYPLPLDFSVAPADVDGDGVADVALNLRSYRWVDDTTGGRHTEFRVQAWVLQGTDGGTLWAA